MEPNIPNDAKPLTAGEKKGLQALVDRMGAPFDGATEEENALQEQVMVEEQEREFALKHHQNVLETFSSLNDALVESGIVAVKSLFLLNGGAALAMLTFIAGVFNNFTFDEAAGFYNSLLWFSIGVGASSVAACGTYLVNFCYASASSALRLTWTYPFEEQTIASDRWEKLGHILHVFTIMAALAALVMFFLGVNSVGTSIVPSAFD